MIITLSPAKLLDFSSPAKVNKSSKLQFVKQAEELNKLLEQLSIDEIADLMHINPTITMQVHNYIHTFMHKDAPKKQAALAFNGIVYQGLDLESLDDKAIDFAQNHLITLSGLYGIIRPLDIIRPYRLEMGREVENPKGNTLYAYWGDTVTDYLSKQLKADDNTWVNLASNEYTKVVNKKKLPEGHRLITPQFKETNGNKFKQIVVYTKKARGLMSRFIIENQLTDVEHVKAFDYEGYSFSPQLSSDKDWVFIR